MAVLRELEELIHSMTFRTVVGKWLAPDEC